MPFTNKSWKKEDVFIQGNEIPSFCGFSGNAYNCHEDIEEEISFNNPGEQCLDKADAGQAYIDFMDNGIIKALEIISSLLFIYFPVHE